MTKSVFFSFHYARDAWRVQQVAQLGRVEGQPILQPQAWEEVKRQGDQAIEHWIAEKMSGRQAVVVLVGAQTAGRPWVQYEIDKALRDGIPLLGVRIHRLEDHSGLTDERGADPFTDLPAQHSGLFRSKVPLFEPKGLNGQGVYQSISEGIESWVGQGYKA